MGSPGLTAGLTPRHFPAGLVLVDGEMLEEPSAPGSAHSSAPHNTCARQVGKFAETWSSCGMDRGASRTGAKTEAS